VRRPARHHARDDPPIARRVLEERGHLVEERARDDVHALARGGEEQDRDAALLRERGGRHLTSTRAWPSPPAAHHPPSATRLPSCARRRHAGVTRRAPVAPEGWPTERG